MLFAILLGMLWVVGAPARFFALCLSIMGVVAFALARTSGERMDRITTFTDPFRDFHGTGWQPAHGLYALSSGGWFGEGIGASRQKWGDLPEAHTDFIFAVLGEELGLIGTLLVIGLFLTIAYAAMRVAQRSTDPFTRYMTFGIVVWLLGQMMINVGMVITAAPGDRDPAAPGVVRRVRAGALPGRARPADRLRAPRAAGRRRPGRASPAPVRRAVRGPRLASTRCAFSSPAAVPPATPRRCWRPPTRCAGSPRTPRSPAWARPRGLENRVVPAAGYPLELIPPVPLPRKPSVDLLRVPGRLRAAVRATHAVLDRVDPDVVVGYGGYVSMPVYLAARRRRLPLVVHEQNALPGLANRAGARVARRVAVSFPDTPLRGAEYVGLPIRTLISGLDRAALRAEARASFGLDPDRPTLLVTGGSQGARRLNESVSAAAAALAEAGRPGAARRRPVRRRPTPVRTGVPYVVVPFVDRMDLAYAAADLVVCRAGASSVTEAAAVGPARGLRAAADRQRRAGAQRPTGGGRRGSVARRRRRADPRVGGRHGPGAGHRPRPAGPDGGGRVGPDPARRRRAAGPDRDRGGRPAMRIPVPDVLLPAEELGRCTSSGSAARVCPRSPGSWPPGASSVTGSDDQDTPFLPVAARARGHLPPAATTPPTSGTPTPWS